MSAIYISPEGTWRCDALKHEIEWELRYKYKPCAKCKKVDVKTKTGVSASKVIMDEGLDWMIERF